jgi:hypothetical protein
MDLRFELAIPSDRWKKFLLIKKPCPYSPTDYGSFILLSGEATNERDLEIFQTICFRFFTSKGRNEEYFQKKGWELNWDFSFSTEDDELRKGAKAIIEDFTLKYSMSQIEKMLWGYKLYVAETAWNWINLRISSKTQERYWEKHGKEKTINKINRFRAKLGLEPIN